MTTTTLLQQATEPGAVQGLPRRLLRSEGAVLFVGAIGVFLGALEQPWWLIPLLLFVPDVSMVGYLRSTRLGAQLYDVAHSYPLPALVLLAATLATDRFGQGVALLWFAHIGMDRALGYGLKYGTGFCDTHLGRIGRSAPPVDSG
jgi:hypothetical protein